MMSKIMNLRDSLKTPQADCEEWRFSVVLCIGCYCMSYTTMDPSDEMRFMLGSRSVWFSRMEFCLITGLKFGAIPNMELYEDVPNGIHHSQDVVTFAELEARIEQGQWQEQFDAVKLCLLYMLNYVLIGAEEMALIPIWQCALMITWRRSRCSHRVHMYTNTPFSGSKRQFSKCLRDTTFSGFAYEVIPSLAKQFATPRAVDQPFLRILRWDLTQRPRGDKLDKVFNTKMFPEAYLIHTQAKKGLWYYQWDKRDIDIVTPMGYRTLASKQQSTNVAAPTTVPDAPARKTRVRFMRGSWIIVGPDAPHVPVHAVVISETTPMSEGASGS
ncbi:hypothetical protein Dsin_012495 [Dipteronia sinensis]|uniref:DUF1985 domain-containing protein n=1 Tax=Dipteronia sinensis TaxID=43782 RepID=A0AAE0AIV6_9ROSI|nr:hypothetical protein Dsin_012495 [Dipteronia sinensis]